MSTESTSSPAVRYDRDAEGIVTLWLDDPEASANTMNGRYLKAMGAAVEQLYRDIAQGGITGVVVASAKRSFFAGGDLETLVAIKPDEAHIAFELVEKTKAQLRRLETCGVPVVAAINGSALGGGLEIALATHHRIAIDDRRIKIGFPESTLGLLPGGGGITRTVRMLGVQRALTDWLLEGKQRNPEQAKAKGLIDELVPDSEALMAAARSWLIAHSDSAGDETNAVRQLWDRADYRMPGGSLNSPELARVLPSLPANVRKQLKGADYPAVRAILEAAVEGAGVDFDTASRIESRYFTTLVTGQNAKDMIQAFFFDMQALTSGALRPEGPPRRSVGKVGVLGAGMMGAGIAYACASRGIDVVLKDVSLEKARKGKEHSRKLLDKKVGRGQLTQEAAATVLARIVPTADDADLAGCDVLIEAVFENSELKGRVFSQAEQHVDPETLLCSNTSTLPITELATAVSRPKDFIGLHFFSPVERMNLVEIIVGKDTGDDALARAVDLVQQIGKLPIVVNDSRGFFTSRVFGTYVLEGAAMLDEGIEPMSVERAGTAAGFPSGPLTLLDEVSLSLPRHIAEEARKAAAKAGKPASEDPGLEVLARMVDEYGRPGRAAGQGFYDYDDGRRDRLWPQLREIFVQPSVDIPFEDMQDRFRFAMALETAKCFEEGVITSTAAANIGSILGIGFPANRGGAARFIENYPGGMGAFIARADELADAYGERFRPTAWLRERAQAGGLLK